MRKLFLWFITLLSLYSISTAKEVPFTQEDRDRLIRLEVKVEALQKQIDDLKVSTQKQIDDLKASTQTQIDDLKTFMLWGFGVLFSGMGILIGLVMWDRRTAISPVAKKTKELEDKSDKIEKVLKDLAKKIPEVEEALKREGLL